VKRLCALAAAIVVMVMALTAVPAVAAPIPAPPGVPDAGHALSAIHKKRCAKRHRKNKRACKRRSTPVAAPSTHWVGDLDGNGTLEVTFDTNRDGIHESVFYDFNQDGYYEVFYTSGASGTAAAFDTNRDTYYEYIHLDSASDGWWDISYYDGNADGWYDAMGFDLNPIDTIMDSWYSLQQPVTASVSPLVSENVVTMNLIRTQDPWAQRDPWGTWAGNAANDPLY